MTHIGQWFMISLLMFMPVSPTLAQNVRITDYDVPVSQAGRFDAGGSARISGDRRGNYRDFQFSGRWERYYNSLPYAWSIAASAAAAVSAQSRRATRNRRDYVLRSSYRRYFREQGLAFGGARLETSARTGYKHLDLWVGASAGLGRFVEATALAKALRIDEFLLKEKILADHLPQETILQLASIIDRAKEYKARHGSTYMVRWYADMDSVIVSSGLSASSSVGPVGNLRMREVIEREPVRSRAHGWNVEAGYGEWFSRANRSGMAYSRPFVAFSFAHPFGLGHQLSISGRAESALEEFFGEWYSVTGSITYSFELSNRIDVLFRETYQGYSDQTEYGPYDRQITRQNSLDMTFVFYLENKLNVQFQTILIHHHDKQYHSAGSGEPPVRDNRRGLDISASIGYRVF